MQESDQPIRAVMFTVLPFVTEMFDTLLTERGHKLVGIVTAPGPRSRRSDEYKVIAQMARPGLDIIISNYPNRWADMIRPLKPDLIFCAGFNWKIPASVLDVPRLGAYNAHDALLPKNRGRNSTGWALRTGGIGYGITIHRMTPDFDDGPVMAQRPVEITDDDDFDSIMPRVAAASREVLDEALDRILSGFPGIPQEESEVTYTGGAFEPEWRYIDWSKPARDVHFQVRSWCGLRGVPIGAFGQINGSQMLIRKTQLLKDHMSTDSPASGTILSSDDAGFLIQCGDGPLRVIDWEEAAEVQT